MIFNKLYGAGVFFRKRIFILIRKHKYAAYSLKRIALTEHVEYTIKLSIDAFHPGRGCTEILT
jgi:hypothetical protein